MPIPAQVPGEVRSLRAFDSPTGSYQPARSDDLAALVRQDFDGTAIASVASGERWQVRLDVAEAVGVLRCLDELAAVYDGDVLAATVSDIAALLRARLERARLAG